MQTVKEGEVQSISNEEAQKLVQEEVNIEREEEKPREYKQVIRELSRLIFKINRPGINEFQIKDLNDKINNLMFGKGAEHGFKEVRGKLRGGLRYESQGAVIPGLHGYRYFGKAQDLPEVKQLLEQNQQVHKYKAKKNEYENIDVQYFGFFDETPELLEKEAEQEKRLRDQIMDQTDFEDEDLTELEDACIDPCTIPSQKQMEQILMARKQQEILNQFTNK